MESLMWWLGLVTVPLMYFFALYFFIQILHVIGIYINYWYEELGEQWVREFKKETPIWQRWMIYWVVGSVIYLAPKFFWMMMDIT